MAEIKECDRKVMSLRQTSDSVSPINRNTILIPVADEGCAARLIDWLQYVQVQHTELMLVYIASPVWFTDVESPIQAIGLMNEQSHLLAAKEAFLQALAAQLETKFHRLRVSWQVEVHADPAEAIVELAQKWNAECITVFAKPKKGIRRLLGNRLAKRIMAKADRTVQIVQSAIEDRTIPPSIVECNAI